MAVKFIIDSASDVLPQEAESLGVAHLPLKVLFGETEYADAVTLSHQEFFEKLTSGSVFPTTSQVSPAEFADAYHRLTANGDTVVVITLSSRLSGTYQSAVIAADDYEGQVYVVDSLTVAPGERILLYRGIALAREGMDAASIAQILDEEKKSIRLFARLDTLEYLKRGGRISATTAAVGGLLNIKPIIAVEEGVVVNAGKARGDKQGDNMMRDMVSKTGGIDTAKPYCLAFSGNSSAPALKFAEDSAQLWDGAEQPPVVSVGCVIGAHTGPGVVAIAYFAR